MYYVCQDAADKWRRISNLPITEISSVKLLRHFARNASLTFEHEDALYLAIPSHSAGRFVAWAVAVPSKKEGDKYPYRIITVKKHREMLETFPDFTEVLDIETPIPVPGNFIFLYREDEITDWAVYTESKIAFPLSAIHRALSEVKPEDGAPITELRVELYTSI